MPDPVYPDLYVYLRGGRGDGFVPEWTGGPAAPDNEETTIEWSEPYRNEFQSSVSAQNSGAPFSTGFGGQVSVPGHLSDLRVETTISGGPGTVTLMPTYAAISDSVKDAMGGDGQPPRQFKKEVTWLVFESNTGPLYKFRKADVIGWGTRRRDE